MKNTKRKQRVCRLKTFLSCCLLLNSLEHQAFSKAKEHNHGVADLSIGAEGKNVVVEFESPADSIYGFEHSPKTAAEKNKQAEGLKKLKENFPSMVNLESTLKCSVNKGSVEAKQESSKHSEVIAKFEFSCEVAATGTKVFVDFSKHFPAVKKIRVQVVSGEKQQGLQFDKKGEVPL